MRIQRTKNASRNMIFGVVQKVYQIIIPFVMRTIMIHYMGISYAGLNNLFTSILQVLNLSELGIGAALIYSMYDPIAKDDTKKICALMSLYRTCFRVIGIVIFVIGCLLLPFLPELISGTIPEGLNLYTLYLMYLGNTVLSYWLFAYKNSLLYSHQRTDVYSKVVLITNTIQYILQVYALLVIQNYYVYLAVSIISQLITNILTARVVDTMYPNYQPRGSVDKETIKDIKKRTKGLITNKIGSTVLLSADSIIISAFLGLSVLAIYQNYFFIVSSVISIIYIIYQSILAGIGNSLIVEKSSKNFKDFRTMTFIISWIATFCSSCLMSLFQPFMKIWMGEGYLLDYPIIICIVIYFYIFEIDQLIGTYKDAAGIWYADRYRPLVTALVNVILNIILIKSMGLYGVILSTIISMLFIEIPWMISNLFHSVFENEKIYPYVLLLIKYAGIAIIINTIVFLICNNIEDDGISTFLVKLVICMIVPNILEVLIFFKNEEFKNVIQIIKKLVDKQLIKNPQ